MPPRVAELLGERLRWSFDACELASACESSGLGPLATLGEVLFCDHGLFEALPVQPEVLRSYLNAVETSYRPVAYHNSTHAACVLHSCNFLLVVSGMADLLAPWELASVLLAAAVHDLGHLGVNNEFLVASGDPLALRYNDVSVLENFHAATAFELMRVPGQELCSGMSRPDALRLRRLIIPLVLATDTARHAQLVEAGRRAPGGLRIGEEGSEERLLALKLVLKLADVGNATKSFPYALRWAAGITAEFWAQGDRERELQLPLLPSNDRHARAFLASQLAFLEHVAEPLYSTAGLLLGPELATSLLARLRCIRGYVERSGAEGPPAESAGR